MINTLVFLLGLSKSQSRFLVRTFRESEVIIGSFSQAQAVIYNGLLDSSLPMSLHAHAELSRRIGRISFRSSPTASKSMLAGVVYALSFGNARQLGYGHCRHCESITSSFPTWVHFPTF
jgi:hypothetical protein